MVGRRGFGIAMVATITVGVPQFVRAAPRLELSGPATIAGDGMATVAIRLRFTPESAVAQLKGVVVSADAGTLAAPQPDGVAVVAYQFTAPRLVAKRTVRISASARLGNTKLTALHQIEVTPFYREVGQQRSDGPFDLRGPDVVRLGFDQEAVISVAGGPGPRPQLFASVGTLSELEPGSDGRLQAVYVPPPTRFPQIAIIGAISADAKTVDWLKLPLWGQGKTQLKSERHANVEVLIGEERFGPVRTNQHGAADLVLAAPPGVLEASTRATDSLGNIRRGRLHLRPPPFARLGVVCPNRGGRAIYFVVDRNGEPAQRPPIQSRAALGQLDEPEQIGPGVFAAIYRPPQSLTAGTKDKIQAWIGKNERAAIQCEVVLDGEMPREVRIVFGTDAYRPGSKQPIAVRVELGYAGRLPPLQVPLELHADIGSVTEPQLGEDGAFHATWNLPEPYDGPAEALLTVRAGDATSEAMIRVIRPAAHEAKATRSSVLGWFSGRVSVGARAGYLTNLHKVAGPLAAVDLAVRLPVLRGSVHVGVDSGVYVSTNDSVADIGTESVRTELRVVPLLMRVIGIYSRSPVAFYAGISAGIVLATANVSSPSTGRLREFVSVPAFTGLGGIELAFGPGRIVAEVAYLRAEFSSALVSGNGGGVHGALGYRYGF
jgi:hypothetical protein